MVFHRYLSSNYPVSRLPSEDLRKTGYLQFHSERGYESKSLMRRPCTVQVGLVVELAQAEADVMARLGQVFKVRLD